MKPELKINGIRLSHYTPSGLQNLLEDREQKIRVAECELEAICDEIDRQTQNNDISARYHTEFNVDGAYQVNYVSAQVYHGLRRLNGLLEKKHPNPTEQAFSYYQNLFAYMGE